MGLGDSSNKLPQVFAESVTTGQIGGGVANDKTLSRIYGERIDARTAVGVPVEYTDVASDYETLVLELNNIDPGSGGFRPVLQFSKDGGSNWITSADYGWSNRFLASDGTSGTNNNSSEGGIDVFDRVNNSDIKTSVTVTVKQMDRSNATVAYMAGAGDTTVLGGTAPYQMTGGGALTTTDQVDSLRIGQFGSKSVTMDVRLYGVMN